MEGSSTTTDTRESISYRNTLLRRSSIAQLDNRFLGLHGLQKNHVRKFSPMVNIYTVEEIERSEPLGGVCEPVRLVGKVCPKQCNPFRGMVKMRRL